MMRRLGWRRCPCGLKASCKLLRVVGWSAGGSGASYGWRHVVAADVGMGGNCDDSVRRDMSTRWATANPLVMADEAPCK